MSMGSTDRITTLNILLNMSMSFLVGIFIFFVYKKTYQGVLYQRSFNISLVLASTVTALIIMTISGNLILSLGMVGALSIVRFRTPIKDSMDLIFLFWAIAAGIANGVGYYNIAIVGSVMIAIILFLFTKFGRSSADVFLLVAQLSDSGAEATVIDKIKQHVDKFSLKSKAISEHGVELTIEVRLKNSDTGFINTLQQENSVSRITLVAYDQELSAV